ncbi:MAG TPA: triacylglycerol lipase, partial [Verrucomicrobiae bacterium]|nr:triacylglycerol lipase [Verrucomicrobiae bacterium]
MRGRHHVYLVPGFFGFTNLGELGYFQHVLEFLRARSTADIHVVRTHPTASLPQRAARVVDAVAATMGRDGPVHLIGHSSGGLDARLAVSPGVSLPSRQNVERIARRV